MQQRQEDRTPRPDVYKVSLSVARREGVLRIDGFVRKSTGESDSEKADEKMWLCSEAGTLTPPPGFSLQRLSGRTIALPPVASPF
jgi:hypothetical protein